MMKTIGIGALNENTKLFYEKVLKSLLGDKAKVKSYNFSINEKSIDDIDILLISTPLMINVVKEFINPNIKIILISRTFTKKSYEILKKIPKGTKMLLVNNGIDVTFETIALIYSLGFKFELFPCYPGVEPKKGIDIAITTNEEQLVPKQVKKVYNIGHMPYDIGTILDLLNELDLDNDEKEKILQRYQKQLVKTETGVHILFGSNIMMQKEINIILDLMNDGILETDNKGNVLMANRKAEALLKTEEKLVGKNLMEIFYKNDIDIEQKEIIKDYLIKYHKKNLIINLKHIHVFNQKLGNIVIIKDVTELRKLEEKVRQEISVKGYMAKYNIDSIIGKSDKLEKTKEIAKKMASSDATILITGESGTGKELFAQAIHNASERKKFPFVAINCAALPESLIESELFGYEGGAFTGAKKEGKPGLFEQAHLGTLFLDEIADLGLKMQARLLRVLQEAEVIRIGSTMIRKVNVRIICATNKDLMKLTQEGKFRWDLYYRLNVFPLKIPSLKEREEDIELIFRHFLKELKCKKRISIEALDMLKKYDWPGNIRELKNLSQYLSKMGSDPIHINDLPYNFDIGNKKKADVDDRLNEIDREILKILYISMKNKEKIGRKKLVFELEKKDYFLTEKEVRNKLDELRNSKYIKIGKGRQGTRIASKGISYIEKDQEI